MLDYDWIKYYWKFISEATLNLRMVSNVSKKKFKNGIPWSKCGCCQLHSSVLNIKSIYLSWLD